MIKDHPFYYELEALKNNSQTLMKKFKKNKIPVCRLTYEEIDYNYITIFNYVSLINSGEFYISFNINVITINVLYTITYDIWNRMVLF